MMDPVLSTLKAQLAQLEAQQAQQRQTTQSAMPSPYGNMPTYDERLTKVEQQVSQLFQAAQIMAKQASEQAAAPDDAKLMFAALGSALSSNHQLLVSQNKEKFFKFLTSDAGKAAATQLVECFDEHLRKTN